MSESNKQIALIPVRSAALTKVGIKSLVVRGRTDLRIREEAEEWLKRGLEFLRQAQIQDMFDDAESFYEDESPCDPSFFANPNNRLECAFTCFERGINLDPNHAELQFWLGNLYTNGQGVPQDYALAASWWRQAAEQGLAKAQHNLGFAYEFGQGVELDHTQAAVWWNKAAKQGYAYAQNDLGYAYERGWGVPQDGEQAAFWYRKAAEQGLPEGQFHIGIFYSCGDVVGLDQVQAAQWYRKAAEQGYAPAQFNLGVCYRDGKGVLEDQAQAEIWYRKAAEQGNESAQMALEALETMRESEQFQPKPNLSTTNESDWRSEKLSEEQMEASIHGLEQSLPSLQIPLEE